MYWWFSSLPHRPTVLPVVVLPAQHLSPGVKTRWHLLLISRLWRTGTKREEARLLQSYEARPRNHAVTQSSTPAFLGSSCQSVWPVCCHRDDEDVDVIAFFSPSATTIDRDGTDDRPSPATIADRWYKMIRICLVETRITTNPMYTKLRASTETHERRGIYMTRPRLAFNLSTTF